MNDGFRQRLVGAIVIGCVLLVLWPVLFSDATGPAVDRRTQIPPAPAFERFEVPTPQPAPALDPAPTPATVVEEPAVVETQPVAEAAPVPAPSLDEKGLPVSWVLQVASFSSRQNADDLTQALQKKGYKAFNRQIRTGGQEATRVYVGPKISKAAALKEKANIDKAFKLDSMVVQYEP